MNRPIEPETRCALLPSEGYPHLRVTVHHYVATVAKQPEHTESPGWAHMFRCSETGVDRVWGFDGSREAS